MGDGATLSLIANLSDQPIARPNVTAKGTLIWGSELNGSLPPWSVFSSIG
jgi:maltooligosyltrehalose trehalohydrolase